ncbi:unnamed protein product [Vitrella brassicaformis CCMP3155]|uniref:Saposin B-type domain-containing protein n=1 Tax=Vitrella brassicaformis (strain CCMP3155) TaxID=1169540 RepID=A0A0G4EH69_VITBC|nr:unnamed protein product [Vitrella brassicaformis CCMP3155]|eukprot:CEL94719.1 unnamed protein product [Vitrella brassicaformis CCMP3155]
MKLYLVVVALISGPLRLVLAWKAWEGDDTFCDSFPLCETVAYVPPPSRPPYVPPDYPDRPPPGKCNESDSTNCTDDEPRPPCTGANCTRQLQVDEIVEPPLDISPEPPAEEPSLPPAPPFACKAKLAELEAQGPIAANATEVGHMSLLSLLMWSDSQCLKRDSGKCYSYSIDGPRCKGFNYPFDFCVPQSFDIYYEKFALLHKLGHILDCGILPACHSAATRSVCEAVDDCQWVQDPYRWREWPCDIKASTLALYVASNGDPTKCPEARKWYDCLKTHDKKTCRSKKHCTDKTGDMYYLPCFPTADTIAKAFKEDASECGPAAKCIALTKKANETCVYNATHNATMYIKQTAAANGSEEYRTPPPVVDPEPGYPPDYYRPPIDHRCWDQTCNTDDCHFNYFWYGLNPGSSLPFGHCDMNAKSPYKHPELRYLHSDRCLRYSLISNRSLIYEWCSRYRTYDRTSGNTTVDTRGCFADSFCKLVCNHEMGRWGRRSGECQESTAGLVDFLYEDGNEKTFRLNLEQCNTVHDWFSWDVNELTQKDPEFAAALQESCPDIPDLSSVVKKTTAESAQALRDFYQPGRPPAPPSIQLPTPPPPRPTLKPPPSKGEWTKPSPPPAKGGCSQLFVGCDELTEIRKYEVKTTISGMSRDKLTNQRNCAISQALAKNLRQNMATSISCDGCDFSFCVGSHNLESCMESPTCDENVQVRRLIRAKTFFLRRLNNEDASVDITSVIQTVGATDDGLDVALTMAESSGELDNSFATALDETDDIDNVVEGVIGVTTDEEIPPAAIVEQVFEEPDINPEYFSVDSDPDHSSSSTEEPDESDEESGASAISTSLITSLALAISSLAFVMQTGREAGVGSALVPGVMILFFILSLTMVLASEPPSRACRLAIDRQRIKGLAAAFDFDLRSTGVFGGLTLKPPVCSRDGMSNAGCCPVLDSVQTNLGAGGNDPLCAAVVTDFTNVAELAVDSDKLEAICTGCFAQAVDALNEGITDANGKGPGCARSSKIIRTLNTLCAKAADEETYCLTKYKDHLEILEAVVEDHAALDPVLVPLANLCTDRCFFTNIGLILNSMGSEVKRANGQRTPRGFADDYIKMLCSRTTQGFCWNKFVSLMPAPGGTRKRPGECSGSGDLTPPESEDESPTGPPKKPGELPQRPPLDGDLGVGRVPERKAQIELEPGNCDDLEARLSANSSDNKYQDKYGCCGALYYQSFIDKQRVAPA